ncbi:hypothetical protein CRUP_023212, partial [Coryphaenoides rupestris]
RSAAPPSTSGFGQQPSGGASIFGQQPSSGGSLFGSSPAGTGGGVGSAGGSGGGGGFFSGLGGKPSEDAANKNPFGAAAASQASSPGGFGQPGGAGLFGSTGSKSFGFGQTSFGEQKSSGTFSAGAGSVASQGFGSFASPTKPASGGRGLAGGGGAEGVLVGCVLAGLPSQAAEEPSSTAAAASATNAATAFGSSSSTSVFGQQPSGGASMFGQVPTCTPYTSSVHSSPHLIQ